MSHFFYLARCSDGSLYSGYTRDVEAREEAHNSGNGAKYTASRRPVKIIYFEEFTTRGEALSREAAVKMLKKADKETLIKESQSLSS